MDINIITFHRDPNYGAMLQTYGLQEFLGQLGHQAGVYDYIRPEGPAGSIKQRLFDFLCRLNKKDCRIREEKFREFCEGYMKLNRELNKDAFVTGSDQVWNPCGAMDENYFLTFVPENVKKLSYAASLSVSEIPQDRKERFKQYIQDFDAISVREERGRECVAELWNREISVHVDPTLLHDKDFWRTVAAPVEGLPENYILVYLMHLPKNVNALLKWLKKETGYEIVVVDSQGSVQGIFTSLVKHDKAIRRAGPREFLWLMDHAKCVVTSSFHGTAFSLIFQKEFYAITNSPTSRVSNILSKCGLNPVAEAAEQFERNQSTDWSHVAQVLLQQREQAAEYFKGVL